MFEYIRFATELLNVYDITIYLIPWIVNACHSKGPRQNIPFRRVNFSEWFRGLKHKSKSHIIYTQPKTFLHLLYAIYLWYPTDTIDDISVFQYIKQVLYIPFS